MILGYNTNGFAHHRLGDALAIIAELGYRGVALTPDVNHPMFGVDVSTIREELERRQLSCVIETGARFLLDPKRKHQPTLLSPTHVDRDRRFAFLADCLRLAKELGSPIVSFWSGTSANGEIGLLVESCRRLADTAARLEVRLAFEPEPGMFIDTMDKFAELHELVDHPHFGLTIDAGHLVCQNEQPIGEHIRKWKPYLWNVHLDDMKPNVHDHLMFGEGTVDFADLFSSLRAIGYTGMMSVELSRHSYDAVNTAARAKTFLDRYLPG